MRVNMSETDVDYMDPALAYYVPSWQILYSACTLLVNYPDRPGQAGAVLRPEAARRMPTISRNGRVYTFTVPAGRFRFANGRPVTASNFRYAINRALSKDMNSPAVPFIEDIVGAPAVVAGRSPRASGISVRGNKLIIRLSRPRGDFLAIMALQFFCAIPTNTPITSAGVNEPMTSGPFRIASRIPRRSITLVKNRFYRGGPIHPPANFDRINITVNTNIEQSLLQTRRGEVDYDAGGLPPTAHAQLGREFGVNRGRYFVNKVPTTFWLALNVSRDYFGPSRAKTNLRKAVNFVLDRPAFVTQRGAYSGAPHDQLLPYGFPGFRNANIYPLRRPNVTRANQLARNKPGRRVIVHTTTSPVGVAWANLIERDLGRIGIEVTHRKFVGGAIYTTGGRRDSTHDIMTAGWHADYADPYNFLDILLNGANIQEANNNNYSYWADPAYIRKMNNASKLTGSKRYRTYGNLDIDIMRNAAPIAPFMVANDRHFISNRVSCFSYQSTYGPSYTRFCRK